MPLITEVNSAMLISSSCSYEISFYGNAEALSFPAEELQKYMTDIFKSSFQISNGIFKSSPAFRLGLFRDPAVSQELSSCNIDFQDMLISDKESYVILIADDSVSFLGNRPRAVLYAVYDFLRNELGCEFAVSADNFEFIPVLKEKRLRISQRMETAAFPVRGLGFHTDDNIDTDLYSGMIDWLAKLKYNRIQLNIRLWEKLSDKIAPLIKERDLDLDLGVHSLGFFLPPARYYENHPEWYAKTDNRFGRQLKFSNLDSISTAVSNITSFLKKTPDLKYLGLWPLDGTAFDPEEISSGEMGDIVLHYVNTVTKAVSPEFPELVIDHLAYVGYVSPPKKTVPNPKIMTSVCEYWDRNFSQTIYDAWYGRGKSASEKAKEKGAKVFNPYRSHRECCEDLFGWIDIGDSIVFSYYTDLNLSTLNIFDIWDLIQQDMQYYHAVGALGSLTCYCMHEEYIWFYREVHALGAFLWNPFANSAKVNEKLIKAVFGNAGDAMRGFYSSLDDLHNKPLFAGFHPADLLGGIIPAYMLSGYNPKIHDLVLGQFDKRWNESVSFLDDAMRKTDLEEKTKEYLSDIKFNMEMQRTFIHLGCHVMCAFAYREMALKGKLDKDKSDKAALEMCGEAYRIFKDFVEYNNKRINRSKGLSRKMQSYRSALEKDFPTISPPF